MSYMQTFVIGMKCLQSATRGLSPMISPMIHSVSGNDFAIAGISLYSRVLYNQTPLYFMVFQMQILLISFKGKYFRKVYAYHCK